MFDFSKHFARRVFITRTQGELAIAIRRRNDHLSQLLGIGWSTVVFTMILLVLLSDSEYALRRLVLAAPFALIYAFLTGIGLWRAFGTEEIIVKDGTFHWTRKALFWKRVFRAAEDDVNNVVAKTKWFDHHVELTVRGRAHSIGSNLLREEAIQIALNLQYALKHRSS